MAASDIQRWILLKLHLQKNDLTSRIVPIHIEPPLKPEFLFKPMRLIVVLLSLIIAFPVTAWEAEIRANGQLIPAELVEGYQAHHNGMEDDCPPLSDIRERDKLVATWVRVQVAEEQSMSINERDAARILELEAELVSERGQNDSEHRNRYHWLILSTKASAYWRGRIGKVTEQEIETEYNRVVKNKDPRFVNAPFFQLAQIERFEKQTLQELADRLRAGETWRQVSIDIDPLDWNSHNKEMWHEFDRLDNYTSKAFHALNIDGQALLRNDVIGPLAENGRFRLLVILDKTTVPIVPLNAKLRSSKKWAAGEIRYDLYKQRHKALNADLLKNVEVTQDGELVSIALEHERCPG